MNQTETRTQPITQPLTRTPPGTPEALVAGIYAGLAAGDATALAAALAPDVVVHVPGTHTLAGTHHGRDAVLGFLLATRELTDDGEQIELLDVLSGEHHVAALCRVTATRAGRAPLDNHTVHLVRFAADQIAEIWLHNRDDIAVNAFWS